MKKKYNASIFANDISKTAPEYEDNFCLVLIRKLRFINTFRNFVKSNTTSNAKFEKCISVSKITILTNLFKSCKGKDFILLKEIH